MKKRSLLLFAAILLAVCVNAQQWAESVKSVTNQLNAYQMKVVPNSATITPVEGQVWWGYMSESDLSSSTTVGIGSPTSFLAAIYIPANHEQLGSSTIKAVRIYVGAGLASTMSDVKVWVSKTRPATAAAADYVQDVTDALVDGANDIELATPYDVNNQGFYIGYAVTSSNNFPIMSCGSDLADAFWICAPGQVSWSDLNEKGFGKLAFQILVENGNFIDYSASPQTIDNQIAQLGGSTTVKVPVTNYGMNTITSIDYTITTDGNTSSEMHADVASPIAFNGSGEVEITLDADSEKGAKEKTITITKINGNENEATNKSVTFVLYTVAELVTHRVTVEEFTGTGCGWCPRGMVGMEKLRDRFGDLFVGIGIHQYNSSDAMYIATSRYAKIGFTGAPSCALDRRYITDPYYGNVSDICDDFSAVQSISALVGVEVEANWNEDGSQVDAKATVQSLLDGANFKIEYVLIGDGIKGTANGFKQSNYYSQYNSSSLPADLADFGSGGKYGTSTVSGLTFNDVALNSSYVSGSNKATPLTNLSSTEPAVSEYTLSLPTTNTTLLNAIDRDQVYVAALIVDNSGIILNAAKAKVQPYVPTGIGVLNVQLSTLEVQQYYTLDGKQLNAPQKGLNIVKYADGSVRKVMVK